MKPTRVKSAASTPPAPARSALSTRLLPIADRIGECVHCGFCLPTCPTYALLGTEIDSPRGRIHLIKALLDDRISPNEDVLAPLDRCLDCRACETACPSGVKYGEILEHARSALEPERKRSPLERWLRTFAFRNILPHRRRVGLALAAGRLGKQLLAPVEPFLSDGLRRALILAPTSHGRSFTLGGPAVTRSTTDREPRGSVILFTGCVMDHAMSDVHAATVRVLSRNGFEVVVPPHQTCCGAIHIHNGDVPTALDLARRNLVAMSGTARIIVNSAGCGSQLREYPVVLRAITGSSEHEGASSNGVVDASTKPFKQRGGSESRLGFPIRERHAFGRWKGVDPTEENVLSFSKRVIDLAAFLVEAGFDPPPTSVKRRAVYDAPCHLHHAQRVTEAPLVLLRAVPGLDLVPLEESDWCCGAAGVYNLVQPALADRLLQRKLDRILEAGADLVITANPGCMLQLAAGLRGLRAGNREIEVVHIAQVLDWAYA